MTVFGNQLYTENEDLRWDAEEHKRVCLGESNSSPSAASDNDASDNDNSMDVSSDTTFV